MARRLEPRQTRPYPVTPGHPDPDGPEGRTYPPPGGSDPLRHRSRVKQMSPAIPHIISSTTTSCNTCSVSPGTAPPRELMRAPRSLLDIALTQLTISHNFYDSLCELSHVMQLEPPRVHFAIIGSGDAMVFDVVEDHDGFRKPTPSFRPWPAAYVKPLSTTKIAARAEYTKRFHKNGCRFALLRAQACGSLCNLEPPSRPDLGFQSLYQRSTKRANVRPLVLEISKGLSRIEWK